MKHMTPEDKQRAWCKANGFGSVTFAELENQKSQVEKPALKSDYVGKVGERIELEHISIVAMPSFDTQFGTKYVVVMKDLDDRSIIWRTTSPPNSFNRGVMVDIKGTVKKHEIYKGERQTILQRVVCVRTHA